MKTDHWDPLPHEREWFHDTVGQRGWRVRREGRDMVRLEGYKEDICRNLSREWSPEYEERDMTPAQLAQVCFEADKKLCFFLGYTKNARQGWVDLHEERRREWIESGPRAEKEVPLHPMRTAVNKAIRKAISSFKEE